MAIKHLRVAIRCATSSNLICGRVLLDREDGSVAGVWHTVSIFGLRPGEWAGLKSYLENLGVEVIYEQAVPADQPEILKRPSGTLNVTFDHVGRSIPKPVEEP